MASNEIFSTEFRGYNKSEVTEYIIALNTQIEQLKAELDNTKSQLIKAQKEVDELSFINTVCEPTEDDLEKVRQSVREQLEPQLRQEISSQLEEKYKNVVEQCVREDKEKNEQMREKAEAYDAQRDLLADIMIKAKADAAQTKAQAEDSAQKLLSEAFDKYTKMRADFELMCQNIAASKEEMDKRIAAVSHYLDDFTQYLSFMGKDIENTGDNFKENM